MKSNGQLFPRVVWCPVVAVFLLGACGHWESQKTEILWDSWGVPHIYARTTQELFHAFGWAQMHSHGNLILRSYGKARGRAAEYWGASYLDSDRYLHTMGVPERSRRWYQAQSPGFRTHLDAFVQGMNDYAVAHKEHIAEEVKAVLPVDGTDVLAQTQRGVHLALVAFDAKPGVQRWTSSAGSNAWAIAPSRSETGRALLLANPHFPWSSDLFTLYEAQFTAPGVDAYGAAFVGLPTLSFAFNDYLGWTHTVPPFDGMDLYELILKDGGYLWDDRVEAFETKTVSLKIKQADGTMADERFEVRHSIHGPILNEKGGEAIAVRMVGLDQPHILEQWWKMVRAKNLGEFEAAIQPLEIPIYTVMYADREGHILYSYGGRVPARAAGDSKYWAGMIPGHTSSTLWTGTLPYADLPRILDPPNGWLQNTNDPPWSATFPILLNPDDYPLHFPQLGGFPFRYDFSIRMLAEGKQVTFERLVGYKFSSFVGMADRILDDVVSAARQQGGHLALEAADVLEKWDGQVEAESRGAVLFAAWFQEMGSLEYMSAWREETPRTPSDGLADSKKVVAALGKAAIKVKNWHGALDVPWGEVYRLRHAQHDFPSSGGPSQLGTFHIIKFMGPDQDGKFSSVAGDSYVSVVEFSNPIRAETLLSYGNATQPYSAHRGDQLKLLAEKKLRPVWRTRAAIEPHLERREVFSQSAD